jgi:poly [ADP-ribose] polymerase
MAPKSKAPPLGECVIALSGTFPGSSQQDLEQEFIIPLGAKLAKTVTNTVTHLVTTETDFAKPSAKVKQAQSHDLHIVKLSWLEDCLEQTKHLDEDAYTFAGSTPALAPASVNASLPPRKRTVVPADDSEDDQSQKQPAKRAKSANAKPAVQSQSTSMPIQFKGGNPPVAIPESKIKSDLADGPTNVAKSSEVKIPMDEHCPHSNYVVYIDDDGLIYDASLNQTNSGNNNNKFYKIQVHVEPPLLSDSWLTTVLRSFATHRATSEPGQDGEE